MQQYFLHGSTIKIQNSFVPFVQFLRKMIIHKGASINHVDKAGGGGVSQMSTLLNKPMY